MATVPPFGELIATTRASAVHLEMRDAYTPDDRRFLDWLAGKPLPVPANPAWSQLVRTHTARGVRFRRARVVSEPLADYIRFEYAITDEVNVHGGPVAVPRRRGAVTPQSAQRGGDLITRHGGERPVRAELGAQAVDHAGVGAARVGAWPPAARTRTHQTPRRE